MNTPPYALAFFQAEPDKVAADMARVFGADVLPALTEAVRRSRLGPYLSPKQAEAELGLTARQLRHLRETRALPYVKVGRVLTYPTQALFEYLDAATVPARLAVTP